MSRIEVHVIGLEDVSRQLQQLSKAAQGEALAEALMAGARVIEREAKYAIQTGPKTGRIYWHGSVAHQASAPGEAPATDTGALVNSIAVERAARREVRVAAGVEYAAYLEFGTVKMQPRPFMRPAVDNHLGEIETAIRRQLSREIESRL